MASYADLGDFDKYGLPSSSTGDADVQAALDAASDLAASYLATRYGAPPTLVAGDVKRAVCIIAAYDIMSLRGYNPEGDAGQLRLRYEDAIRWLEGVAAGDVTPQDPPDGEGTTPGQVGSSGVFAVSAYEPRGW